MILCHNALCVTRSLEISVYNILPPSFGSDFRPCLDVRVEKAPTELATAE
jgi:hypothetical protein